MVFSLVLYFENNLWYFDDHDKGIYKELFVMGSSEIITFLVVNTVGASIADKILLKFSDSLLTCIFYINKKEKLI